MHDVRRLEGVLHALKEKAAKARAEQTGKKALPVLHESQITYALLLLDAGKTKKQRVDAFDAWLEQPEMKERLRQYRYSPSGGKTGGPKDRLKHLAAWRLFEHCKGDWIKAFRFANKYRKKTDTNKPRPFHSARAAGKGQQEEKKEALLYSTEQTFLDAIKSAQRYLRQRIPWEFFEEAQQAQLYKIHARVEKVYVVGGGVCEEPLREANEVPLGRPDLAKEGLSEFKGLLALKKEELRLRLNREARQLRAFDPGI
jgi:hypothetical protein